jgi:hypothetical protein
VRAVVSGHLHSAEVLGFAGRRAPQLVAGNGGTLLDSQIAAPIVGTNAAGARIVAALAARLLYARPALARPGIEPP